jgi:hypothetical protein
MLVNLHAITSTRVLFRVDVTYQIKLKKNTRNFHVCLHSVHDSQEKFHLHLEWKGNIQLKIMACYVHTNMADTIRLINPNSPLFILIIPLK